MNDAHNTIIQQFMANIGMDGLGFDNNGMVSFAINQQMQIVLRNNDDGIIYMVPMPQCPLQGETALKLLEYNYVLSRRGDYGYFMLDSTQNIIVYQVLIPTNKCNILQIFQDEILKHIQFCEDFITANQDNNTSDSSTKETPPPQFFV